MREANGSGEMLEWRKKLRPPTLRRASSLKPYRLYVASASPTSVDLSDHTIKSSFKIPPRLARFRKFPAFREHPALSLPTDDLRIQGLSAEFMFGIRLAFPLA